MTGATTSVAAEIPFEEEADAHGLRADDATALVLDIDGWEGPLDLLLALARSQKVDLRHISILQLADQYLEYVARVRRTRLELAAEYLVMAAWLADLKSRLLLPEPPGPEEPSSEEMAQALSLQLRRLDAMRTLGAKITQRPQLQRDFWLGEQREGPEERRCEVLTLDATDFTRAYVAVLRRKNRTRPLPVVADPLESVEDALERIRRSLGHAPDWESLARYLPSGTLEGLRTGTLSARASLAATFVAILELTRVGALALRQSRTFGPIYVKPMAFPLVESGSTGVEAGPEGAW